MRALAILKEVKAVGDPKQFFRTNCSELVNKKYIERYSKDTIALKLSGFGRYLVTSQSGTAAFKQWIEE